jgi:hypothetical protein
LAKDVSTPMFRLTVESIGHIYDAFGQDVTDFVRRERLLGVSNEEIIKRLDASLNNGKDLFGRFKGAIELELDNIVGVTAQAESNGIYTEGAMLTWELDPTVSDHCETCLSNADKAAMAIDKWELVGLPGFGNTICGRYCKCTLVEA